MTDLESRALAKTWFYPFQLPSGRTTPTYGTGELDAIHHTRTRMLDALLAREFPSDRGVASAVGGGGAAGAVRAEGRERPCSFRQ